MGNPALPVRSLHRRTSVELLLTMGTAEVGIMSNAERRIDEEARELVAQAAASCGASKQITREGFERLVNAVAVELRVAAKGGDST